MESSNVNKSSKRRKIFTDEISEKFAEGMKSSDIIEETGANFLAKRTRMTTLN